MLTIKMLMLTLPLSKRMIQKIESNQNVDYIKVSKCYILMGGAIIMSILTDLGLIAHFIVALLLPIIYLFIAILSIGVIFLYVAALPYLLLGYLLYYLLFHFKKIGIACFLFDKARLLSEEILHEQAKG